MSQIMTNFTKICKFKKVNLINRKQANGESIETYGRTLNVLANNCKYKSCCLDRMIRDIFVAGIRDAAILTSLLQECDRNSDIKFEDILEKAKIHEQLHIDAITIKGDNYEYERTHAIRKPGSASVLSEKYVCIRCKARNKHLASECFAINLTCKSCGRKGHIAKACISKDKVKYIHNDPETTYKASDDTVNVHEREHSMAREGAGAHHMTGSGSWTNHSTARKPKHHSQTADSNSTELDNLNKSYYCQDINCNCDDFLE